MLLGAGIQSRGMIRKLHCQQRGATVRHGEEGSWVCAYCHYVLPKEITREEHYPKCPGGYKPEEESEDMPDTDWRERIIFTCTHPACDEIIMAIETPSTAEEEELTELEIRTRSRVFPASVPDQVNIAFPTMTAKMQLLCGKCGEWSEYDFEASLNGN
jgi:hypothetical protein